MKSNDLDSLVYTILRAHESYSVKTGMWIVSLSPFSMSRPVRTIFHPVSVQFPNYTKIEILDILKTRAEYGLYEGVVSDKVLERIAEHSARADLRTGIEMLKLSALEAESRSSSEISEDDVKKVALSIGSSFEEMLECIGDGCESGELYKRYKKKAQVSYATFYRILGRMEEDGIIKTQAMRKGRGNSRMVNVV